MTRTCNLYEGNFPEQNREVFSTLFDNGIVRVESIRSWLKTPGEWYDQNEDEWVLLFEGEADLEIGDKVLHLTRGDHVMIPRHTPHRVLFTSENAYWIGVFSS